MLLATALLIIGLLLVVYSAGCVGITQRGDDYT